MAGNSGGGMETLQFAPFESRIKAAAPMCAVAGFRQKTEALLIADPEQILYGTLRHGIDHTELLASVAPRPLMIGSATRDFVPIEGARATYQAVSRAYGLVKANEKVTLTETDDVHGLNKDLREAAARWFSRWLSDGQVSEQDPSGDVLPAAELHCTPTGQGRNRLCRRGSGHRLQLEPTVRGEDFAEIARSRPLPANLPSSKPRSTGR